MSSLSVRAWLALGVSAVIVSVAITAWAVKGPLASSAPSFAASTGPDASGVSYAASWPRSYSGISDLTRAADLVIVGRVTGGQQQTNEIGKSHPTPILVTDFTVAVSQVLKGNVRAGTSIVVRQTGGVQTDGSQIQVSDDPLFVNGATYLLFLSNNASSGLYTVLSGPFGRFVVQGGQIEDMKHAYPRLSIADTNVDGITLQQVASDVSAAG